MQVMATHVNGYVQQIATIAEVVGYDSFERGIIVRLVKKVTTFPKLAIRIEFNIHMKIK